MVRHVQAQVSSAVVGGTSDPRSCDTVLHVIDEYAVFVKKEAHANDIKFGHDATAEKSNATTRVVAHPLIPSVVWPRWPSRRRRRHFWSPSCLAYVPPFYPN